MAIVKLKKSREKSVRHRHPWVYSGAVDSVEGQPDSGALVTVLDARGDFLARGYYNAQSKIAVRVLEWDESAEIDGSWWEARIGTAVKSRESVLGDGRTNACRLVHAEADLLPGLIVDRYNDVIVTQFLTAGVDRARQAILDAIEAAAGPRAIYDRSDTAARAREGLDTSTGWVRGEATPDVEFLENGLTFTANITSGQKTGFYFDQRDNRALLAEYVAEKDVLDAFCYTGAFSVYAARAGAKSLTLADSSSAALKTARTNLESNGASTAAVEFVQEDVFGVLRLHRQEGRRYDVVVLDPPKFATSKHQLDKAMRAYKDINMIAMGLLNPGGILATFSCSGAVDTAGFSMAVSWAGIDAGRNVQIVRRLSQAPDHPVLASFPESEYLKGMIARVS